MEKPVLKSHLVVQRTNLTMDILQNRSSALCLQTKTSQLEEVFSISTLFDHNLEINRRGPRGQLTGEANLQWTQDERSRASKALRVSDLPELQDKVRS